MLASTWKSYGWALCGLLLLGLAATVATSQRVNLVLADQPLSKLQLPDVEFPKPGESPKPDGRAKEIIRKALENPGQAGATGDAVLDGFLDVIRQQGSLVEQRIPNPPNFSSPEERTDSNEQTQRNERAQRDEQTQRNEWAQRNERAQPNEWAPEPAQTHQGPSLQSLSLPGNHENSGRPATASENDYLLAEQLLMTARLLAQDSELGERRQLIQMLRNEAARCLNKRQTSMSYPVPPNRLNPQFNGNPPPTQIRSSY